ncbi:MAG: NAD-dependent epimerase/dehydratase family protein [Solirubrobacteraceae bacterium]
MILVTGGAGFIGSHIVDALLEQGQQVRIIDSLLAHREVPDYLPEGAELLQADLRDAGAVRAALSGVEHVCHQAGMVGLGQSFLDAPDSVSHNDTGTAVLLAELVRSGWAGRLVLASSMVVYGEGRYRCSEHGLVRPGPRTERDLRAGHFEPHCPQCGCELHAEPIPEDAVLDPRNVYAATKLHQEHLCEAFARENGSQVTALRYHNVYGPRMPRDTPYAGVASLFASALQGGRRPRVFEDGAQLRDFVHVRDVARANLLALLGGRAVCGSFNVASGSPRSVGEMAQALANAYDGNVEPLVTGEFRLGDVRHVFASNSRAAHELGFSAEEDFAAGMREFAAARLRAG